MPLRPAHVHDLAAISGIFADAFWSERVMGELMHPHRAAYPRDYRRFWKRSVIEWYWDYSHQLVVMYVTKPTDDGKEEDILVGVADWERYGKGWERYWGLWGTWDLPYTRALTRVSVPGRIMRPLMSLRNRIELLIHPNRAADPSMPDIYSTIKPLLANSRSGSRSTGWYLNCLAVDPVYEKQGHGRVLVAWGIDQATREKIAASVTSGERRDNFYRRCGFDIEVGRVTDGEGNPLKNKTDGGAILFRDP